MTQPISVTEDRVTVTANDTEANIRAGAGFTTPESADEPTARARDGRSNDGSAVKAKAESSQAETETPSPESLSDRNPDGTFKTGDPRKSYQAKINQSIAKQREAERRAEALEAELQTYKQPKPAPVQPSQPEPVQPKAAPYLSDVNRYKAMADAPKLDDFVSDDDPYSAYHAALAVFIADQRMSERDQREADTRAQRARGDAAKTAIDLAEEKHPGFMAAFDAEERQYPAAVLNLLADEAQRDPHFSAELLHHLLTHPDDATHLAAQTHPIAAAREIGRIAAQVSASAGPEPVAPQTTAKPLIKPVRPSIVASESPSTENLPFSKYMQVMNEQERKARTRA